MVSCQPGYINADGLENATCPHGELQRPAMWWHKEDAPATGFVCEYDQKDHVVCLALKHSLMESSNRALSKLADAHLV